MAFYGPSIFGAKVHWPERGLWVLLPCIYIYINNNHSSGSNYTPKNCTSGRILSSNSTYGKSPFSQVNFKCAIFHGNVSLLEGKHCPGSRPPEVAQSRSWRGERPEHRWGKT